MSKTFSMKLKVDDTMSSFLSFLRRLKTKLRRTTRRKRRRNLSQKLSSRSRRATLLKNLLRIQSVYLSVSVMQNKLSKRRLDSNAMMFRWKHQLLKK